MVEKKISVIVTTYNSKENFTKTYQSIKQQSYDNIEIVVIDGASIDGTVEKIQKYAESENEGIHWISEKDKGIYDAINKGIKIATGDYIIVCNDIYSDKDALKKLVGAIEADESVIGAHADLVYCKAGNIKRFWKMGQGQIEQGWMPAHPTLLLKKNVYEKYGLYKTDYRCSADYEFMVRILKNDNNKLGYVPEVLVSMFYGGTSSNGIKAYIISFEEAYRALKENDVRGAMMISLKRACRVFMQFLAGKIWREKDGYDKGSM